MTTRYARQFAASLVAVGCLVIFCGIAAVSPIAALIILAGSTLVVLGAFVVEVPEP